MRQGLATQTAGSSPGGQGPLRAPRGTSCRAQRRRAVHQPHGGRHRRLSGSARRRLSHRWSLASSERALQLYGKVKVAPCHEIEGVASAESDAAKLPDEGPKPGIVEDAVSLHAECGRVGCELHITRIRLVMH